MAFLEWVSKLFFNGLSVLMNSEGDYMIPVFHWTEKPTYPVLDSGKSKLLYPSEMSWKTTGRFLEYNGAFE